MALITLEKKREYVENRRHKMLVDPTYAERRKNQKRAANTADKLSGALRRLAIRIASGPMYQGAPCKRGHSGLRYSTNQTCVECMKQHAVKSGNMRLARMKDSTQIDFRAAYRAQKNAAGKRWRDSHPAEKRAEWQAYHAAKIHRLPAWADLEKIKAFYRLREEFSRLYVEHHVDHILPLRGGLVSGLHVHENLRVIPATDNLIKGSRLLEAA